MNQRKQFVLRAVQGGARRNMRALCREFGISAKTGYKWIERFWEQGLERMGEKSRRPLRIEGLGEGVVCELIRLKGLHPGWGPRKIRVLFERIRVEAAPSESSVKRVLERAGLVTKRRLRVRSQAGRLHSGRQASAPNEVWTVDFKGWWRGTNGVRCEPLTVRDEFTRYVLEMRTLANGRTETVQKVFEDLFERHGLPQAIRSDNGAPFASRRGLLGLTRLSAWWLALGIDLERNRPGCPQDNPAHERFHLDIARELEKARLGEEQASLDVWRQEFNEERPHEALSMKCPAELYQRSKSAYPGKVELVCPGMQTRRVNGVGCICWNKQSVFISTALKGWMLGLELREDGLRTVWFGKLCLGELDPVRCSFQSVVAAVARDANQAKKAA